MEDIECNMCCWRVYLQLQVYARTVENEVISGKDLSQQELVDCMRKVRGVGGGDIMRCWSAIICAGCREEEAKAGNMQQVLFDGGVSSCGRGEMWVNRFLEVCR